MLGQLSDLILGLGEYETRAEEKKKEYDDLKKAQDAARSEEKQADKLQEELEKKEAEFNKNANEVIDNFNKIQQQINKFSAQMEIRQGELDEELALKEAFVPETEGDVFNDARELLLNDYVSVYQEAIDSLNIQMEAAQSEFEIITEEKRLREEQAEAVAAQKAKEAEYNDQRAAVDFAKEEKEEAKHAYDVALAAFEACDPAEMDCGDLETAKTTAEEAYTMIEEVYNEVKASFDIVNGELKAKQEEATERALQKQRTQVFNMVKNDGAFINQTADTMKARIDWIKEHVAGLEEEAKIPNDFNLSENPDKLNGKWLNVAILEDPDFEELQWDPNNSAHT